MDLLDLRSLIFYPVSTRLRFRHVMCDLVSPGHLLFSATLEMLYLGTSFSLLVFAVFFLELTTFVFSASYPLINRGHTIGARLNIFAQSLRSTIDAPHSLVTISFLRAKMAETGLSPHRPS